MSKLLSIVLFTLLWHCPLVAQFIFSPQGVVGRGKGASTVWAVSVCLPPGSASRNLSAGRIYAVMVSNNLTYKLYEQSVDLLRLRQTHSKPAIALKWVGYGAIGLSYVIQLNWVQAKPGWQRGATAAAGVLGLLVPALRQEIPPPREWERLLLRDSLPITGNDRDVSCASAVVLGSAGPPFVAALN